MYLKLHACVFFFLTIMAADAWLLSGTCSCCCRASSICCCCFSSSRAAMFLCSEWAPSSCSLRPLSWLIIISSWSSFSARDSGVPVGKSEVIRGKFVYTDPFRHKAIQSAFQRHGNALKIQYWAIQTNKNQIEYMKAQNQKRNFGNI